MTNKAKTNERAESVQRALIHHNQTGAVRSWSRTSTVGATDWRVDLAGGRVPLVLSLAETAALCEGLAAGERQHRRPITPLPKGVSFVWDVKEFCSVDTDDDRSWRVICWDFAGNEHVIGVMSKGSAEHQRDQVHAALRTWPTFR